MSKGVKFKEISVHETPEQSPGFLLWHVSTAWRSSIEAVLKPLSLTHPQFVVLATLGWLTRNKERVTQVAIGKMAGLDPNTTSQILRGLENKKLIKRESSLDGRAKNPLLTDLGADILIKALPAVEMADAKFFKGLNSQEMTLILKMFKKMGDDLI